jgi:hypothetical protein
MKHLLWLLTLGAWMVSGVTWAADGSRPSASDVAAVAAIDSTSDRGTAIVDRYLICDSAGGNGTFCTSFDTKSRGGTPTRAVFSFVRGNGTCTGDTVTPMGSDVAALSLFSAIGPSGSTTLAPPSSGTVQQMVVEPIINRYLTVQKNDADSSCTDIEVLLQLFYDKTEGQR